MFHECRKYYTMLADSIDYTSDKDDLGHNEFGYVYRVLVELSPFRWQHGAAIQARVVKLVETKNGERLAYKYYQQWFYDRDFERPLQTLMMALVKGEISGATATDAIADIYMATLKKTNYVAKFAPKYWARWKELTKATESEFPEPSENPDDWARPELIRQPFDEMIQVDR